MTENICRRGSDLPVRAIVSESKDPSRPIKSTKVSTSSNADYTAVKEIKGLKPDTQYYYDVILNSKSSLTPEVPSFRTYFSQASKADSKIAFGGGPHCGFCARLRINLALLACGYNSLFYMDLSTLQILNYLHLLRLSAAACIKAGFRRVLLYG